jgi:ubiquinone/menaquinone biosynthesis C-methylase UbiE
MPDIMDRSPVWTGERAIEGMTPLHFWQDHVARYRFANHYARGRVLDIACGTGYGCKMLLNRATTRIVGIDISQDAISLASKPYKDDRIAFMVGNILDIELPNGSQDVITCFETIEHVKEPETAISELCRVLNPNGILIISTPNRKVFRKIYPESPFHVSEFSTKEFVSFLRRYFGTVTFFGQHGKNKLFLWLWHKFLSDCFRRFVTRKKLSSLESMSPSSLESMSPSSLEGISPFKDYLYVTAICARLRMR